MNGWKYRQMNGLWFRCQIGVDEAGRKEVVVTRRSANKKEIAWIRRWIRKQLATQQVA